jgi:hypothetical protein
MRLSFVVASLALISFFVVVSLVQISPEIQPSPEEPLSRRSSSPVHVEAGSKAPEKSLREQARVNFRQFIDEVQHPKSCQDAKFLVLAPQIFGLGSWLNLLLNGITEGEFVLFA